MKDSLAEAVGQMRRELIWILVKPEEIGEEEIEVIFRIPPEADGSGSDKIVCDIIGSLVSPSVGHKQSYICYW